MLLIFYDFIINHQSDFKNLTDELFWHFDYEREQTFIDYFLTLQQKFNHLAAFILNMLKIRYIVMLQVYDVMKINCIIIKYSIMIKRSSTISITERAHFKLHALKSF